MKQLLILSILLLQSFCVFSQKYMTQSGTISFFSEAPIENIESTNNQVSSVINLENGQLVFSLLMKAFVFEKALMQEHFNEKYVESDIYPKAIFKGQIQDFETIELSTTPLDVAVVGTLTIHGESHEITSVGQMYYDENNRIRVNSTIEVALDKYKIKIPSSVQENISNTIAITIQMEYEKLD
ncbi:MAG: hypothetical protein ACJAYL_002267 [Cryomorphaceae bacterium]|jgi:hypothetical protein